MHEDERVEIEKAEVFRVLPPERLIRIKPLLHERRFTARRVLYFEGTEADRLWVVRAGSVRLYKASMQAHVTTLDVLGAGEVFGALTTASQEIYPSSAEAVRDGSAWWLARESYLRLLESEPAVALEILEVVARRLRHAQDRLRAFAHDSAPARLASALLEATSAGETRITRRALAEAAGTTVETAIRVLRRFESRSLLHGEVGRIEILDRDTLAQIGSGRSS